jgi:hypothetical protein
VRRFTYCKSQQIVETQLSTSVVPFLSLFSVSTLPRKQICAWDPIRKDFDFFVWIRSRVVVVSDHVVRGWFFKVACSCPPAPSLFLFRCQQSAKQANASCKHLPNRNALLIDLSTGHRVSNASSERFWLKKAETHKMQILFARKQRKTITK